MARGVPCVSVRLVQMPHSYIVAPDIHRLRWRNGTIPIIHRELRVRGGRGQFHPDERLAARIPRVDFVGKRLAVFVYEHHVPAVREREIVVVESDDGRLVQTHERGNPRRDCSRRQIGHERDFDRLPERGRLRHGTLERIGCGDDAARPLPRCIGARLDRRRRGDGDGGGVFRAGIGRNGAVDRVVDRRPFRRARERHARRWIERGARRRIERGIRSALAVLVAAHGRRIGERDVVEVEPDPFVGRTRVDRGRSRGQVVVAVRRVDEPRLAATGDTLRLGSKSGGPVREQVVGGLRCIARHDSIVTGQREVRIGAFASRNVVREKAVDEREAEFVGGIILRRVHASARSGRLVVRDRRVADREQVVIIPERSVDSPAIAVRDGVSVDQARIDEDDSRRIVDADAAAIAGTVNRIAAIGCDDRVVDLSPAFVETDRAAVEVVCRCRPRARGIVDNTAPRDRSILDIGASP